MCIRDRYNGHVRAGISVAFTIASPVDMVERTVLVAKIDVEMVRACHMRKARPKHSRGRILEGRIKIYIGPFDKLSGP